MKDFIKQAAHVKPDANQLRLNDNDVKRLNELGELIKNSFRTNLAEGKEITIEPYNGSETQRVITIELGERMKLNFLELSEILPRVSALKTSLSSTEMRTKSGSTALRAQQ